MYARDSAERRAAFWLRGLPHHIFPRVLFERNGGISTLLRTVMHQAVFADIKKAASRGAMPLIRQRANDILLKSVKMSEGEKPASQSDDAVIDAGLRVS